MMSNVKGDAAGVSLYISIFVVDIKLRISKGTCCKRNEHETPEHRRVEDQNVNREESCY